MREIAHGLRFPEGPIALPDGSFLLVEIERRTLTRISPDGVVTVAAELGGGPNGAAIGPDGCVYVCNNGGFRFHEDELGLRPLGQSEDYLTGSLQRVDLATGAVTTLYTRTDDGIDLRGPNDLVFDPAGGIWFTDMGKVRPRDQDRGRVYYARADGSSCRLVIEPMVMANGIGLSPDGATLYVAETETARLWAFTVTGPGEVEKRPFPSPHGGRLLYGAGGYQRFDSLAVEAGGNICIATLINGGVTVIAPDGRLVEFVALPDYYPTNICFGGPGLAKAYVTLSQAGRLVELDWPRPGLPLSFRDRLRA